jgi:esterase
LRVRMGLILQHRDLGGEGPPLVILHGMLGSSRNWQTVGRELASTNHVWALDARNHGQSPHAEPMDYPAMAADVIQWLDAQGLAKVTLMGHSMGGKTAMLLACRHPDRVDRLIVVDIAPKDYHWVGRRAEYDAMNALDLSAIKTRADAEKQLETTIDDWAMRKFITTNLERTAEGAWRWVINLPVLTSALGVLERTPLTTTDHYSGPTQFILGGKSPYVTSADHGVIQTHFPAARIDLLPEAGHNPHMDAREPFIKLVSSFLADS